MTDLRKAAEMALEALEWNYGTDLENIENCMAWLDKMNATIPALRQALAQPEPVCAHGLGKTKCDFCKQPEQEPVAWVNKDGWFRKSEDADSAFRAYAVPLYAGPTKKEWVGLTDEEKKKFVIAYFVDKYDRETAVTLMDDYEAVLKEKNT